MQLESVIGRAVRGFAACASIAVVAAVFTACGGSTSPTPAATAKANSPAFTATIRLHDALLKTRYNGPAGFGDGVVEDVPLTTSDKDAGAVGKVTVSFDRPQRSGFTYLLFDSAAEATAFGRDFGAALPSDAVRRDTGIPGAICADSKRLGGVCGFQLGQVFITTSAADVASGALPLLGVATAAYGPAQAP